MGLNLNTNILVVALAVFAAGHASSAEDYGPGVSDTEIRLGQTVAYSGPASAFSSYGRTMTGYFQMINEAGGINGRKITLISRDNAYSPSKAIEQTRGLVESDEVLADVGTVGTIPNVAIQKYLNGAKVPHIFIAAGGKRFADRQTFPWSVPMFPGFEMEGRTFARYILLNKADGKIGVLYQNDDYGRDFLAGFKSALGDKSRIIAELSYEITQPTIESQIVRLRDAGADTVLYFATPKFTAQALRKVKEIGWTPLQFVVSPSNSVKGVLEPAGLESVQGVITSQFTKQAGDPAWDADPEVIEYVAFMKRWAANDSATDSVSLSAYIISQGIARAIEQCGNNLTRENLLKQVTSMTGQRFKMMLPGIALSTSATDYTPFRFLRVAKFQGNSWVLLDESDTPSRAN